MKLSRKNFGTVFAIGIRSEEGETKEDIERQYFGFWNHKGTDGELHWLTDNYAYFWSKPDDLEHALIEISLCELLNLDFGRSKGKYRGLMPDAELRAKQKFDAMEYDDGMLDSAGVDDEPFKMGYIDFQTPNLTYMSLS